MPTRPLMLLVVVCGLAVVCAHQDRCSDWSWSSSDSALNANASAAGGQVCEDRRLDCSLDDPVAGALKAVPRLDPIHWRKDEFFALFQKAVALFDDEAVRASPLFASAVPPWFRERFELWNGVFSANESFGLPPATVNIVRKVYAICHDTALSALMDHKLGKELRPYISKSDMATLLIVRYTNTTESLPLPHHIDPSLFTLHVPVDSVESFLASSSFFPGEQAEMLTKGKLKAQHHEATTGTWRAAIMFFLQVDNNTPLTPLPFSSAPNASQPITGGQHLHKSTKVATATAMALHHPVYDTFHHSPASIEAHWHLLCQLNEGDGSKAVRLPSVVGESGMQYWQEQILFYKKWLVSVQIFLHSGHKMSQLPAPPRVIRWLWVAHMLQPSTYAKDCKKLFGEVLQHDNTMPVQEAPSLRFRVWWKSCLGKAYPGASERNAPLPNLSVDWQKGLDSAAALYDAVLAELGKDMEFDTTMITNYKRFMHAADEAYIAQESCVLGPDTLIDLTWHAHQCNPKAYAEDNQRRMVARNVSFLDHEPCGELNPAKPEWYTNTVKQWERLFPGTQPPVFRGDSGRCGACCGLCSSDSSSSSGGGGGGSPPPPAPPPPTKKPTNFPTDPTKSPTDFPTGYPTAPTPSPTDYPTGYPTAPTPDPTAYPTSCPTLYPTPAPTAPTRAPTNVPTHAPTSPWWAESPGATVGFVFIILSSFAAALAMLAVVYTRIIVPQTPVVIPQEMHPPCKVRPF